MAVTLPIVSGGGSKVTINGEKVKGKVNFISKPVDSYVCEFGGYLNIARAKFFGSDNNIHAFIGTSTSSIRYEGYYVYDDTLREFVKKSDTPYKNSNAPYNISSCCSLNGELHVFCSYSSGGAVYHTTYDGTDWTIKSECPYIGKKIAYNGYMYSYEGSSIVKFDGVDWVIVDNVPDGILDKMIDWTVYGESLYIFVKNKCFILTGEEWNAVDNILPLTSDDVAEIVTIVSTQHGIYMNKNCTFEKIPGDDININQTLIYKFMYRLSDDYKTWEPIDLFFMASYPLSSDTKYEGELYSIGADLYYMSTYDYGSFSTSSADIYTYSLHKISFTENYYISDIPNFPKYDSLENMSWNDISSISRAGLARKYWNIGDTKTIHIGDDEYKVKIIGFYHDSIGDAVIGSDISYHHSGRAGITFKLCGPVQNIDTVYGNTSTDNMIVGWNESILRNSVLTTILADIGVSEPELFNNIIPVVKRTQYTEYTSSGSIDKSVDLTEKLFLLSLTEINPSTYYSIASNILAPSDYEGLQYEYYKKGYLSEENADGLLYWTRSRYELNVGRDEEQLLFAIDGSLDIVPYTNFVPKNNTTDTAHVSFAFCI